MGGKRISIHLFTHKSVTLLNPFLYHPTEWTVRKLWYVPVFYFFLLCPSRELHGCPEPFLPRPRGGMTSRGAGGPVASALLHSQMPLHESVDPLPRASLRTVQRCQISLFKNENSFFFFFLRIKAMCLGIHTYVIKILKSGWNEELQNPES